MKKLSLLACSALLFSGLTSCDSLEDTSLVRTETVMPVSGDTLIYQMYMTGLYKFRYEFNLVNSRDTTNVFSTEFTDESGNEARMEIEPSATLIRIELDKPIENQTKTIKGVTYELKGTR